MEARSKELQKLGVGVKIVCVGKRAMTLTLVVNTPTQVEARSKELQKLGVGVKIVCVGKRAMTLTLVANTATHRWRRAARSCRKAGRGHEDCRKRVVTLTLTIALPRRWRRAARSCRSWAWA